jgi:hypothetical protein
MEEEENKDKEMMEEYVYGQKVGRKIPEVLFLTECLVSSKQVVELNVTVFCGYGPL